MKITKKQQDEIDFFCLKARVPFIPTKQECEDYIRETVMGENIIGNRISESKRGFDISIPMWRRDLVNGLLSIDELYEDYGGHSFGKKLIDSVLKSLNFSKYKNDEGYMVIAAMNAVKKEKLIVKPQ